MKGLGFYGKPFFTVKTDKDLVSESIIRLIMTNFGERVGRPYFGINLKSRLFEMSDNISQEEIRADIIRNIEDYEPRATITTLDINNSDENAINLKIGFKLNEEQTLGDERFINITYKLE